MGADGNNSRNFVIENNYTVANGTDFVITTAGYVGIGTNAPNAPLHIKGDDPDLILDITCTFIYNKHDQSVLFFVFLFVVEMLVL